MEMIVYILCAVASLLCAGLLIRGYMRNPTKLLLWSAVCFAGLAINNILLCVDFALGDSYDLSVARGLCSIAAMAALLYGLIWEVA